MVRYLTCACANALPLLRNLLQEAGRADWLSAPVTQGRERCLAELDVFPDDFQALSAFQGLYGHIQQHSSYIIVIGYDDTTFYWADIAKNSPKDRVEAQAILERFA